MTLPSVVLPGGSSGGGGDSGPVTIHNYFPDGAITDASLVDVDNVQDYHDHIWEGYIGTETLSFIAAADAGEWFAQRFNTVKIAVPGNQWSEGVQIGDFDNVYDTQVEPNRRYQIGFTIHNAEFGVIASLSGTVGFEFNTAPLRIAPCLEGYPQRFAIEIAPVVTTGLELTILTSGDIAVNGAFPSPAPGSFYVAQIMMTEGDALVFADGDSAGWSWAGTHHASVSSGPQG